jgi:hypothetical protein
MYAKYTVRAVFHERVAHGGGQQGATWSKRAEQTQIHVFVFTFTFWALRVRNILRERFFMRGWPMEWS